MSGSLFFAENATAKTSAEKFEQLKRDIAPPSKMILPWHGKVLELERGWLLKFDSTAVRLFGRIYSDVNRVAHPGSPRGSPCG